MEVSETTQSSSDYSIKLDGELLNEQTSQAGTYSAEFCFQDLTQTNWRLELGRYEHFCSVWSCYGKCLGSVPTYKAWDWTRPTVLVMYCLHICVVYTGVETATVSLTGDNLAVRHELWRSGHIISGCPRRTLNLYMRTRHKPILRCPYLHQPNSPLQFSTKNDTRIYRGQTRRERLFRDFKDWFSFFIFFPSWTPEEEFARVTDWYSSKAVSVTIAVSNRKVFFIERSTLIEA